MGFLFISNMNSKFTDGEKLNKRSSDGTFKQYSQISIHKISKKHLWNLLVDLMARTHCCCGCSCSCSWPGHSGKDINVRNGVVDSCGQCQKHSHNAFRHYLNDARTEKGREWERGRERERERETDRQTGTYRTLAHILQHNWIRLVML